MIYVFRLLDKPDTAALRQRVRPRAQGLPGAVAERIAFAGPLTHDDGVTMIGSLLAIDFDSRDAAQAWLADEPFTRAGLYASTRDPRLRQPVAAARRLCAIAMNARHKVEHETRHEVAAKNRACSPLPAGVTAGHHHQETNDHVQALR